jgi:hypothetical protein
MTRRFANYSATRKERFKDLGYDFDLADLQVTTIDATSNTMTTATSGSTVAYNVMNGELPEIDDRLTHTGLTSDVRKTQTSSTEYGTTIEFLFGMQERYGGELETVLGMMTNAD